MSAFSLLGIILLLIGLALLGYQGLSAFLDMGQSDEFVYENIRFVEILGEGFSNWIAGISSPTIQGIAETMVYAPLAVWMVGGALLCFLIHAVRGTKHMR